MNRIELHIKTKYSTDYDSTIDIYSIIGNAIDEKIKGIGFVDKDSIMAFPKIEESYNLLKKDYNFKIVYGVELTTDTDNQIIVYVKNQEGLKDLYKLMSLYLNKWDKHISISNIKRDNLLVGIRYNNNIDECKLYDFIEISENESKPNIELPIIITNRPNALLTGEIKAKEVLNYHMKINKKPKTRLMLDDIEDDSNVIFNMIDKVTINNQTFANYDMSIHSNLEKYEVTKSYDSFFEFIRLRFNLKYKNPSSETVDRLEKELKLIKELNYGYYFVMAMLIRDFCVENNEYYQIDGYTNNSIVMYVLDITNIEPYNLPYELFFCEIPCLHIRVSSKFYYEKLYEFINDNLTLLKCSYSFKLDEQNIPRIIKHYEKMNNIEFNSNMKDYIVDCLKDIPIYEKEFMSHSYHVIPYKMEFEDFSPYEQDNTYYNDEIGTHFDYHDLKNNLIKLNFILNDDIEIIGNLINKTHNKPKLLNDKRIYNLFRNTESFNTKFKILDKETGLLNIKYFEEIEDRLINIKSIWLDDLINELLKIYKGIIKDDLYNELDMDDIHKFNVLNILKEKTILISRAFLINRVRISYMQMFYKLYYPKEYYEEMLSRIMYKHIKDDVFKYEIETIKKRYYELNEKNNLHLTIEENEEYELLKILLEMYERNIDFKFSNKKVEIKKI